MATQKQKLEDLSKKIEDLTKRLQMVERELEKKSDIIIKMDRVVNLGGVEVLDKVLDTVCQESDGPDIDDPTP